MKLTDAKLRNLSAPTKIQRIADGAGLYLEMTPAGGKYWRMKYRYGGKEKRLAFGVYPDVGLKEARDKVEAARKTLQSGNDPGEVKKAEKTKQAYEAANTLKADIFPVFGTRPLVAIKPSEVMRAVQKIESRGAGDQAGRVLQRVKAIYRWAVTHGRIESSPMDSLMPSEILKPREVKHRATISDRDLPEFLSKLDAYPGDPTTANALRFLILTATRPGEVRGAKWSEINFADALWIIPAERMKMRLEHRVPLSIQAIKVLKFMQSLNGDRELVFASPSYKVKPISENTFNSALRRMGYDTATAHGFRSLFSTVTNEHDRSLGDVVERALAHRDRNKVRAAYLRSTFLNDRTNLMQWWADFLDKKRGEFK